MTLPMFIESSLRIEDLGIGKNIVLTGSEAHHAVVVRRIKSGEQIMVTNGFGLCAKITVKQVSKNELSGEIFEYFQESASPIKITLVQALVKAGRDEQAIETATEFGVHQLIPWEAHRSIVSWAGNTKTAKGKAKWEATVIAAAKQARRTWLPTVDEKVTSQQLAIWIEKEKEKGGQVFVCHESGEEKFSKVFQEMFQKKCGDTHTEIKSISFIVGPEGGISEPEIAAFSQAGAQIVALGEHILRAATAGPWAIAAATALLQGES